MDLNDVGSVDHDIVIGALLRFNSHAVPFRLHRIRRHDAAAGDVDYAYVRMLAVDHTA